MNNKILTAISVIIIILIIGFGFITGENDDTAGTDLVEYEDTALLMDTINEIRVYVPDEETGRQAVDEVFVRLQELDEKLDIYRNDSPLAKINENAGQEPVEIDEGTFSLLQKSINYAGELEGVFDPTIGALTLLWGWGTEEGPAVPSQEEIDEAVELVGYNMMELDETAFTARLERDGMKLDLGAIAKGYASQEVYDILADHPVEGAFINLGGNITLKDMKPDETPWRIGIQNPRSGRGEVMAAVEVDEDDLEAARAVVTSGDYERYFEEDGEKYHHIIDPFTGYPSDHGVISTTIITDDPIRADAYSTGILVKGYEGLELVEEKENMEAIFVNEDSEIFATSGIEDEIEIFDEDFEIVEWAEFN